MKYVIELIPKSPSFEKHIWKEGGVFKTKDSAEFHAKQIRTNKNLYSKVIVRPETSSELLNRLYEEHKDKFKYSSFHNMLWQIIMNDKFSGKEVALTAIVGNGANELVISHKNEKGYNGIGVYFDLHNYDDCNDIADILNEEIFGLDEVDGSTIILSSL